MGFADPTSLLEAGEQVLIEALVAQPSIERLDEGVLQGLTRRDLVLLDVLILLPAKDGERGELGTVVTDHHARPATPFEEAVELASDADTR